jgi:hypothetical protein
MGRVMVSTNLKREYKNENNDNFNRVFIKRTNEPALAPVCPASKFSRLLGEPFDSTTVSEMLGFHQMVYQPAVPRR